MMREKCTRNFQVIDNISELDEKITNLIFPLGFLALGMFLLRNIIINVLGKQWNKEIIFCK